MIFDQNYNKASVMDDDTNDVDLVNKDPDTEEGQKAIAN